MGLKRYCANGDLLPCDPKCECGLRKSHATSPSVRVQHGSLLSCLDAHDAVGKLQRSAILDTTYSIFIFIFPVTPRMDYRDEGSLIDCDF